MDAKLFEEVHRVVVTAHADERADIDANERDSSLVFIRDSLQPGLVVRALVLAPGYDLPSPSGGGPTT